MATSDTIAKPATVPAKKRSSSTIIARVTVAVMVVVLGTVVGLFLTNTTVPPAPVLSTVQFPYGTLNHLDPSGMAPPGTHALAGYSRTYVTTFSGKVLPSGWQIFAGKPGGDPGGQFAINHVVFADGLLSLNAKKDPAFHNEWVTGGLCQCGLAKTYGAFFVRSRVTGVGPNEVELLWPASNAWPPEVDFNESGQSITKTTATLHWSPRNDIAQISKNINLLKWHTWGVIWTAKAITLTVDGREWASTTNVREIPKQPMTLDLEQRTECSLGRQCPSVPVSMLVDWVAEYSPNKAK